MILGLQFYQFVVAALAAYMIFDGLYRFARGGPNQSTLKVGARVFVWGSMGIVAVFPKITYALARFIGIEGNINAVILIGFLLIFLMIFKILSVIERIEQQITILTRQDALQRSSLPTTHQNPEK